MQGISLALINKCVVINRRIMYKDSTNTKPKLFYGKVVKCIVYGKRKHFIFRIIVGTVKFIAKGKEYV